MQDLCLRVYQRIATENDLFRLYQIAEDMGIHNARELDPFQICNLLMRIEDDRKRGSLSPRSHPTFKKAKVAVEDDTFDFGSLPTLVQFQIWQSFLRDKGIIYKDELIPLVETFGTLSSETRPEFLRSSRYLYKQLQQKLVYIPEHELLPCMISMPNVNTLDKQSECFIQRKKIHIRQMLDPDALDVEDAKENAYNDILDSFESEEEGLAFLDSPMWNCEWVRIQYPLHDILPLYTDRVYKSDKDYFSTWDLYQLAFDFYWTVYATSEIDSFIANLPLAHQITVDQNDEGEEEILLQQEEEIRHGRFLKYTDIAGFVKDRDRNGSYIRVIIEF